MGDTPASWRGAWATARANAAVARIATAAGARWSGPIRDGFAGIQTCANSTIPPIATSQKTVGDVRLSAAARQRNRRSTQAYEPWWITAAPGRNNRSTQTTKVRTHQPEESKRPVSYTHLDVYKRQPRAGVFLPWLSGCFCCSVPAPP